jgi:hypothetical protein
MLLSYSGMGERVVLASYNRIRICCVTVLGTNASANEIDEYGHLRCILQTGRARCVHEVIYHDSPVEDDAEVFC